MFADMDAFWEFIKAQGTQTARVWGETPNREAVREVAPVLAANLDALLAGYNTRVAPAPSAPRRRRHR